MDFLLLVLIAMLVVFCLYMADAVLQLKADVQVIRKKVNILTASPDPPSPSSAKKASSSSSSSAETTTGDGAAAAAAPKNRD